MFVRFCALLLVGAAVAGCATASHGIGPRLIGPTWRVVHFQSSDDAIGLARPEAGETYSVTFKPDGSLAAQFSCNRGSGRWRAPDPAASRGSISIGPVAATERACYPETMNFPADLGRIHSYVIAGGRLTLSLMADGGTYLLEPAP